MRDSERVKLFKKSKKSYRSVAASAGANVKSVWEAVRGRIKRPRHETAVAIADAIGRPVHEVFPALSDEAAVTSG
ncbi:MAG: hypothetical protein H7099_17495 [Gemmatimonadaceae bacterium]|nr:hypothetical protein [Gemmatimonadaceae bacterium]